MKKRFSSMFALCLAICSINAQALDGGKSLQELAMLKMQITNDYLNDPSLFMNKSRGGSSDQDCINAIAVCQQSYIQNTSYAGFGTQNDLFPNFTCLLTGETNSVWYVFTVQTSGSFIFSLQTFFDYDFALYNITNTGCNLGGVTPLRCNYSADPGNTGLQLPAQSGNLFHDALSSSFMPGVDVQAGETYALLVNNWTGDQTGYTLTFGGTASIFDNTPPTLSGIDDDCTTGTLLISTSEPINCSSISSANVSITGPALATVNSITGVGCGGFTSQLQISYSLATTTGGVYAVTISNLEDNCGNNMLPNSLEFNVLSNPMPVANPAMICGGSGESVTLSLDTLPAGVTATWSNGNIGTSTTVTPVNTTSYSVTVSNGNCTKTGAVTVVVGNPLVVNILPELTLSCTGGPVQLTTDAPSGSSFLWSTGDTTPSISITKSGSVAVTVTDTSGCVGSASKEVRISNLDIGDTITNVSCFGEDDGKIELTVSGAIQPISYSWSDGSHDKNLTGVEAGAYSVTITDSIGCISVFYDTITEPAMLLAPISKTNANCAGGEDGSINLTATGGTSPYSYNWSTGDTTQDIAGLAGGSYFVTLEDANGCLITSGIVIEEPTEISLSTSETDAFCSGSHNGAINLEVMGGSLPYSYSWNNGDTTQDISGLNSGTYTVTVMDGNNCSVSTTTTVNELQGISISYTSQNVLCHGDSTGSIDIEIAGGTSPYSYNWNTGEVSEDINNLPTGIYRLSVTDANSCVSADTITITGPALLDLSLNVINNISCFGAMDGIIEATATGGILPYSYQWDTGDMASKISGLGDGDYTVTVTDANSCKMVASLALAEPDEIALVSSAGNSNCNGSASGSLNITVSGGISPYNYIWSTGDSSQSLNGISAGSYTVTATDANGCMATLTDSVGEPEAITITGIVKDVSCMGCNNGAIDISVSGGHLPYFYSWNNNQTVPDLNNLNAGTYEVMVTDIKGCNAIASFTVNQPLQFTVSLDITDNTICKQQPVQTSCDCDGKMRSFTLIYNGNDGATIKAFESSGQNLIETFTNVQNGDVLTVKADSLNGGQFKSKTFLYNVPGNNETEIHTSCSQDILGLTIGDFTVIGFIDGAGNTCGGLPTQPACNGSIEVSVIGGTPPLSYSWNTGDSTALLNGLCTDSYIVTVTDAGGITVIDTAVINDGPTFNLAFTTTNDSSCNQPTLPPCDCECDGKMQNFKVRYLGIDTVEVKAYSKSDHNLLLASFSEVAPGDELFIEATLNGGQFESNTYLQIVGGDEINIHTSCSKDIGGEVFGQFEVIGFTDGSGGICDLSGGCEPACECAGDITSITVEFNGMAGSTVNVYANSGHQDLIQTYSNVQPGDLLFVHYSSALNDKTYFEVVGSPDIKIYTKCDGSGGSKSKQSKAGNFKAGLGNTYGDFTVVGYSDTEGNKCGSNRCSGTGAIALTVNGGQPPYSYNWSNGASSPNLNNLCSGVYTVTVSDSNGCSHIDTVSIQHMSPDPFVINVTTEDNTVCDFDNNNCDCDGKMQSFTIQYIGQDSVDIMVFESSGQSNLINTFTNVQSGDILTASASGLSGGQFKSNTYLFNMTTGRETAIHTSCSKPILGLTFDNYTVVGWVDGAGNNCNTTVCNGSAEVNVSGGVGPFTYTWSNGDNRPLANDLCPDTYTVTITDANGCDETISFTIDQAPPSISISATVTDDTNCDSIPEILPPCDCACDGKMQNFTVKYIGPDSVDIEAYSSSNHSLLLASFTNVQNGDILFVEATLNGGQFESSTYIQVIGGDETGIHTSCSKDIGGQTFGDFEVTGYTDGEGGICDLSGGCQEACGCEGDLTSITVEYIGAAGATVNVYGSSGHQDLITTFIGVQTGDLLTVNSGGALDDKTYFEVVGSPDIKIYTKCDGSGGSKGKLGNLKAGLGETYGDFTIVGYADSEGNTCGAESCSGTGIIDLAVSGGQAPYTFNWSDGSSGQTLTGLCEGIYYVTITDAGGCSINDSVAVGCGPDTCIMALNATAVDATCFGASNGSVQLTINQGRAPFDISWSNGASTQNISGVIAGEYTVTVSDNKGCVDSVLTTVNQPDALTLGATTTPVNCFGQSDGAIDLIVSGGTPPYLYSWSNGESMQDLDSIPAGTYDVIVTDANNCDASVMIQVTQSQSILLNVNVTDITCNGENNGIIDLTITGGESPYNYNWSIGANTQDISQLDAGQYSVTVSDTNNCSVIDTFNIEEPPLLNMSLQVNNITCIASADGSLCIQANGGVTPYTYSWSTGGTSVCIEDLDAGSYTATVTDANGCTMSNSATLMNPEALNITISTTEVSCFGASDGTADITVTGGTPPYNYLWDNGETTEDLSGLPAGSIGLSVIDDVGCNSSASALIDQPDSLTIDITVTDASCSGMEVGAIDINVSGGTAPYQFSWSTGATTEDIDLLASGNYSVTVTDNNGCNKILNNIAVNAPNAISVSINTNNVSCLGTSDGSASANVTGGTPPYSFLWNSGDTTEQISGLAAGGISLMVTDSKGCMASASAIIQQPDSLLLSASVKDVNCFSGTDGEIDLMITGGTMPYSYAWSNGATSQDLNGVVKATYFVTVTDANGCSAMLSATVDQPGPLALGAVTSPVSCFGRSDGAVNLTVLGGIAPLSYHWSTGEMMEDIGGLVAGAYTVTVTDANGCDATLIANVTQPQQLQLSADISNPSLPGGSDGAIDLSVMGGSSPYFYEWSTGATVQDITGLSAGSYLVTVTDDNGCSRADLFELIDGFRTITPGSIPFFNSQPPKNFITPLTAVQANNRQALENNENANTKAAKSGFKQDQELSFEAKAYPNPFSQYIQLNLQSSETGYAEIIIMDLFEKVVINFKEEIYAGEKKILMSLQDIPDGLYFIRIVLNNETRVLKVEKFN